ncbi:hypothetical protein [Propionivibrio sp.]|nr:hypothetical protein [Propionivibrio sp.]
MLPLAAIPLTEIAVGTVVGVIVAALAPERIDVTVKFKDKS